MPTNLLQQHGNPERRAVLKAGRVAVPILLHKTVTADLIWRALPLHSIAETWGGSLHFDTPLRTGRDRTARLNARPGDVCFWAEDERIVIVWGGTPISGAGEIRLMRPCNIWAHALEDASAFSKVTPGEKVVLEKARAGKA
ncbi:MAG TPA: cyclophilin-like family protein [Hyphomicrobiaceae bacterium]|nr:cyclophilin-like family protein [Hyphomicrobiaceae bacterium]